MTAVKPAESLDTDLSVEPPCEHPQHGTGSPFHADGTPYYVRFIAPCGHYGPGIAVACERWVVTLRGCYCGPCDATYPAAEAVEVLGPVRDFQ